MHAEGELAGARAAEKYGTPFRLSTVGTTSIEDAFSPSPKGANWFQIYVWKDSDASIQLVERARKAGVTILIFTVDVPVAGARLCSCSKFQESKREMLKYILIQEL